MGFIRISRELIDEMMTGSDESRAGWHAVFGKCIPVEINDNRWRSHEIEYLVHCADFDEVDVPCIPPSYEVIIGRIDEQIGAQAVVTYTAQFKRIR